MALDEKEQQIALDAYLAVSQARLQCNDCERELVKQTIRLRDEDVKLEAAQNNLRKLIKGEPLT